MLLRSAMAAAAGHTISPLMLSAAVRDVSATAIVYVSARSGMVAVGWGQRNPYQSAILRTGC